MFRKPEENHEVHDKHTADGVGTGPDPEKGRFMNLMLLQQKPPVLYNVVCPKCPELANPFRWKGD